jgi:cysteine-rich repeat protein
MRRINSFGTLLSLGLLGLSVLGCNDDTTVMPPGTGTGDTTGTGAETETGDGDGDGDDPGDGDGDGDGDDVCPVGTEGCACAPGDVCDEPLLCIDGTCEEPEPDPVCGNGLIEGDEECDDGEDNANTAACKLDCTAQICGDGFIGNAEACDDGNVDDTDDCTNACGLPGCGDGIMQAGEECDDGNDIDTDDCLPSCIAASCGDLFVLEGVEDCDDGNDIDTDACLPSCVPASCGDSLVWAGQEDCDDGNDLDTDACLTGCVAASCGDSFVWAGSEQCDDGNMDDTDACPTSCLAATCGDTFVWAGNEDCDDGNDIDVDACLTDCVAASCGDTFIWTGNEQCDDGNSVDLDGCNSNCNETGAIVWEQTFNAGPGSCDYFLGVDVAANGRIAVVGSVNKLADPLTDCEILVHVYEEDGTLVWSSIPSETPNCDEAWGVDWDAQNNLWVSGTVYDVNLKRQQWVRRYDPAGGTLWTRTYGDVLDDIAYGLAVDTMGRGVISGFSQFNATGSDLTLRAISADGDSVWDRTVHYGLNDSARDTFAANDMIFVVGYVEVVGQGQNGWAAQYDLAGNQVWTHQYNGNLNNLDRAGGITRGPDGTLAIIGLETAPASHDAFTQKLDAAGQTIWTRTYNNPATNYVDRGQKVAIDSLGNIISAGQTWDTGVNADNFDTWLRKYDADGNEVWTDITAGAVDGEDLWWAIDIAPNDELILAGGMTNDPANCIDAVLRRYAR